MPGGDETDRPGVYIFVEEVQTALGWAHKSRAKHRLGYKRTVRWLSRRHLLLRRGGRLVTTRDLLMTELPEVWDRLAQDATEFEYR